MATLFQKHIVGLHVFSTQGGKRAHYVYTGFLLDFYGFCVWVTAGHVIEELDKMLAEESIDIHGAEWCDGYPATGAESIRVNIAELDKGYFKKDYVDVGLIWLRPNTVNLLKANDGIQFVTPQIWSGNASANPDGYHLVGIPAEHQTSHTIRVEPNKIWTATRFPIVCLPLTRENASENECGELSSRDDRFCGRLVDTQVQGVGNVNSIVGISGGPILSISQDANRAMRYRLHAIQSCWNSTSRIIWGTPIEFLDSELRRVFGEIEDHGHS